MEPEEGDAIPPSASPFGEGGEAAAGRYPVGKMFYTTRLMLATL